MLATINDLGYYVEFLEEMGYYDDIPYLMDDFNELHNGVEPWEVARRIHFGEFNPTDEYWKYNGYGNLESMSEYELVAEMNDNMEFFEWYNEKLVEEEDE